MLPKKNGMLNKRLGNNQRPSSADSQSSYISEASYQSGLNLTSSRPSSPSSSRPSSSRPSSSRPSSPSSSNTYFNSEEVEPLPYPDANKVFKEITQKMASITQKFKDQLKNDELNLIKGTPVPPETLPNYYLFVVLNNKILGVFESETEFKLETTNKYENTELLPKNYITSERVNSVSQLKPDNDLTAVTIPGRQNRYIDMDSDSPVIKGTIIEFYVYDANSNLQKTYFTYGSIFIYGQGIASTCEIKELEGVVKTDVLPHGIPATKFDPKQRSFDELIVEIKSNIFGSDTRESLKMNKVYIHYLNAISPDDLKLVLNNNDKIKAVIKILYVNISSNSSPVIYNLLHKYINYYYAYKTRSLSKIEKYIGSNEYSQFVMHIFDFFEFLMFLKDKESSNTALINCCIEVYNSYKANYANGFTALGVTNDLISQIQQKILEKQKKIYTYLQIVSDTHDYNTRYEVKLNKNLGGNYGQSKTPIDENTSMSLTFKTKTGSNPEVFDQETYKFGPFDKIYKPDFGNTKYTDIVSSPAFNQIITKVTSGSPMMFSFYGPSGSGKTKVLKSVLISLCNKLGYTDLQIGFKEIYRMYDSGEIHNGEVKNFQLKFINSQFKIASDEKSKTFKKDETLDKLLNYFLDENRLTKAILSNHHSSRSHVLCFLKMKPPGKPDCNIIFADLAGNEKKYDCSNEKILKLFKGLPKEVGYENEFDSTGNIFDSYKGGETLKDQMIKNGKESELYNKLIGKACAHRVVEGEFINNSLKEFRTDLEYMVDVKNRENEYYVPDIYHNITDSNGLRTCLQDFCFGKTNCFQLTKVGEPYEEPKSVIFKSVYEYLKVNSPLNLNSPLDFYDKLEVCLFGTLNVTSKQTEPPTKYVDINTVKSIIRGKDEFTFNNNPKGFETFKTEMEKTKNYATRIHSINSFFPEKYISELLDRCYDGIIDKKEKDSLTLAEIETIKKVFDAIDDENAKTAIGTLEFMNRVSKFNTVNSTCFGKNDNANYEPLIKPMNI
jgi:hypothetical protein